MNYLERLEQMDEAGTLLVPARRRVLLWTGQSGYAAGALRGEQREFLAAVAGEDAVMAGFPFHHEFDREYELRIWRASWRNARQTWWCAANGRYRRAVGRVLRQAVESVSERLMIVCGSCGMEIVNAACEEMGGRLPQKVEIVGLGPTCLRPLRLERVRVVQGRGDRWSQWLYRGPVAAVSNGGHLDYWQCEQTRGVVRGWWRA
jgi:hypothetical protein